MGSGKSGYFAVNGSNISKLPHRMKFRAKNEQRMVDRREQSMAFQINRSQNWLFILNLKYICLIEWKFGVVCQLQFHTYWF